MMSSKIIQGTVAPFPWFERRLASQLDAEIARRIADTAVRNACFSPIWGISNRHEGNYAHPLHLWPPCYMNGGSPKRSSVL